jgi:hypothetical protein
MNVLDTIMNLFNFNPGGSPRNTYTISFVEDVFGGQELLSVEVTVKGKLKLQVGEGIDKIDSTV